MIQERKTVRSLFGIIILDQIYLTIATPILTLIFFDTQSRLFTEDTSFATRSMWYGLCVALPNMINLFFAPCLSALSDEFGRRKIMLLEIFSAFLFTLFVGLGIYLGTLGFVFLGIIIKGAFARINPTALAMIGDTVPKDKKIHFMTYLQCAISIGAFAGPILSGYVANRFFFAELNFSLPFFIGSFLALTNLILTFLLIGETLKKSTHQSFAHFNWPAIKRIITHKDVLRISLILLLIQISWSTYYQFTPPLLKIWYGFNPHELGWFTGMIAFWLAIATSIGFYILRRLLTSHQLLLLSVYLVILGLLMTVSACLLLPSQSIWVWIGAIPIASGDVLAYSSLTALYSNAVSHEEQGKVIGIGFIIVGSAWAATGFLGGMLMGLSPLLPLIIAPLSAIIALCLMHADFGKKLVLNYA